MTLESEALANAARRPRLTAGLERVLRVLPACAALRATTPLESIPRRLLVVKVHGMGDGVLIRLIMEQLRKRHATMQIGVLAGAATREILTLGTDFRIHLYDQKGLTSRGAFDSLREIRRAGYDTVLNFEQGSIAGTAFIRCTGIPTRIGFIPLEYSPKSIFLTHGMRFDESHSMWRSFVKLAQLVDPGLTETAVALPMPPGADTEEWLTGWWWENLGDRDEETIAFHVGSAAGMEFRRWPLRNFVALAERIALERPGATIVLTGTTLDKQPIAEFMTAYRGRTVDASNAGSLTRTAAILKRARLLVSNDTGVMHLGAALDVGTVGLFGPNTPKHWAPIGRRATYVYETSVACSPCVDNYRNQTPSRCTNVEQGRCMRDISVEAVMQAARRVTPNGWLA
jgi:heptosyltransferase-2